MYKTITAITLLALAVIPMPAEASPVTPREIREGKVTACSSYGSDCYTAKLVRSPVGWKMRLKGGTLVDCSATCRDTLRRETVDFWHDQRERNR
ncbi:MAG: hypothetical protein B7Y80_12330 [Hyphomicrobium sp. 32-62-53]|nr:MAG: hypothetical protein B7Z29_00580 [Hyphomicrobium sp. 12-62-95]OYX99288.1 MAG: hypothetical protein B7Y80_12330 [Hyphomicrobium sp. 32-62-53]